MKKCFYLILLWSCFSFATKNANPNPWTAEFGVSYGSPSPLFLTAGLNYQLSENWGALTRFEGLGLYQKTNYFWCGARGALGVSLFRKSSFFLEGSISGGYFYARAPNYIHQAFNEINEGHYIYEFNWKEVLDLSTELGVHLWGVHLRVAFPILIKGNASDSRIWRIGYLWSFN
ncbi:MAG TPA: hypothetical protein GX724_03300 [Fibrobacter sp.]|nr:hypothetical protein [Fibrobacter sp.]